MQRHGWVLVLVFLALGCEKAEPGGASAAKTAPAAVKADQGMAEAAVAPAQRKLIRRGELELEVSSPASLDARARSVAKDLGGYVEASSAQPASDSREGDVSLTLRVPAARFDEALAKLKALAGSDGTVRERVSTEDVTDNHVDLTARLAAKRKLEQRYLALLEKSDSVTDALAVEKQLGQVRTDIERFEGQLARLDKQTDLSTIELKLRAQRPLVAASLGDFGRNAKRAGGDAVTIGAGLINGGIRLLGVLLPVFLFFGLPGWLIGRRLWRLMWGSATTAATPAGGQSGTP